MSTKYPFPSHVSVQSFVTVKLSDKHMYGLWKKQILCLLDSHDMLGFIKETSPDPVMQVDDEHRLWNKSDVLVRCWILCSLSEQAAITVLNRLEPKLHQQTHITAKHIWDQVQNMYGQQAEKEDEKKGGEAEEGCGSPCIDLIKIVEEEQERLRKKKVLYNAISCGKLQEVVCILEKEKIGITGSISSINGNTALHIAVAYRDDDDDGDGFLKSLLDLSDHNIPLQEVRNSDGSTPLHLAASLGKTNAAKILLDRCPDLLYAKDKQGCTPLDIILSQPWNNKEMCLFLMKFAMHPDIEQAGHEPLVTAISDRHFDLALAYIKRFNSLKSPDVLMAIAQNCPADFTLNQLIIYELLRTPVLHFITRGISDMKGCMKLVNLVLGAVLAYSDKTLLRICMKLQVFKYLKESMKQRGDARDLLDVVCALIRFSNEAQSYRDFYSDAMLVAIRRDASDVVEIIVNWFPEAALIVDEDGHNLAQAAWKNRASKVYALILDGNLAKHTSLSQESKKEHHCGNNFLHFAAQLGPTKKLDFVSCPPFRMQRELQWFKKAQEIIPQGHTEKNWLGETPEMVFTKEHKNLEIESGEWVKRVANSVAITATLIITVMFAATIQIPGGINNNGLPNLISHPAFILFEMSITISAGASCLSLLLFLGFLTSPLTEDDFMLRLPLGMVIGAVSLFVSVTFGWFAFDAALFLLFETIGQWFLCLVVPPIALSGFAFYLIYSWFVWNTVADFMYSTCQFLIIHGFHRLNLVGQIFI